MAHRIFILVIIISIFNTSNAMKIVKKTKHEKEHRHSHYDYLNNHPTNKELLFAHAIQKRNLLPKEITKDIVQYCVLLKNKDFENSTEPFVKEWHDFRIPTFYHYLLTQKQMCLMQALFASHPQKGNTLQAHREISYILPSKKDYKLFLTLPIELRRCLTLLPKTELILQESMYIGPKRAINYAINPTTTIEVKCLLPSNDARYIGCKSKPIVPEDKKKH